MGKLSTHWKLTLLGAFVAMAAVAVGCSRGSGSSDQPKDREAKAPIQLHFEAQVSLTSGEADWGLSLDGVVGADGAAYSIRPVQANGSPLDLPIVALVADEVEVRVVDDGTRFYRSEPLGSKWVRVDTDVSPAAPDGPQAVLGERLDQMMVAAGLGRNLLDVLDWFSDTPFAGSPTDLVDDKDFERLQDPELAGATSMSEVSVVNPATGQLLRVSLAFSGSTKPGEAVTPPDDAVVFSAAK